MEKYYDVVIVGAGIAGLATALGLKRVGIRAMVLERSHELRATGAALGLAPNAWRALDALGVAHKLIPLYSALTRDYITDVGSGKVVAITFRGTQDREGMGARSVHRKALLEALAQELPPETILFSSKLASITTKVHQDSSLAVLHMEDGTIINAKVLIGCDGVHSVVAQWLGLKAPIHSSRMGVRGLAVYPQGHGFQHRFQRFVHVGLRAGFVTVNSTDVYWYITYKSCVKGIIFLLDGRRDSGSINRQLGNSLSYDSFLATTTYWKRKDKAQESCDSSLKTNLQLGQSFKMVQ